MSYKINGTVVVDNSRNVCACCVTACCITGTTKVTVPYGDTASRPAAGAGVLYYDTDEGSLVVNDGTDWAAAGGATSTFTIVCGDSPVTKRCDPVGIVKILDAGQYGCMWRNCCVPCKLCTIGLSSWQGKSGYGMQFGYSPGHYNTADCNYTAYYAAQWYPGQCHCIIWVSDRGIPHKTGCGTRVYFTNQEDPCANAWNYNSPTVSCRPASTMRTKYYVTNSGAMDFPNYWCAANTGTFCGICICSFPKMSVEHIDECGNVLHANDLGGELIPCATCGIKCINIKTGDLVLNPHLGIAPEGMRSRLSMGALCAWADNPLMEACLPFCCCCFVPGGTCCLYTCQQCGCLYQHQTGWEFTINPENYGQSQHTVLADAFGNGFNCSYYNVGTNIYNQVMTGYKSLNHAYGTNGNMTRVGLNGIMTNVCGTAISNAECLQYNCSLMGTIITTCPAQYLYNKSAYVCTVCNLCDGSCIMAMPTDETPAYMYIEKRFPGCSGYCCGFGPIAYTATQIGGITFFDKTCRYMHVIANYYGCNCCWQEWCIGNFQGCSACCQFQCTSNVPIIRTFDTCTGCMLHMTGANMCCVCGSPGGNYLTNSAVCNFFSANPHLNEKYIADGCCIGYAHKQQMELASYRCIICRIECGGAKNGLCGTPSGRWGMDPLPNQRWGVWSCNYCKYYMPAGPNTNPWTQPGTGVAVFDGTTCRIECTLMSSKGFTNNTVCRPYALGGVFIVNGCECRVPMMNLLNACYPGLINNTTCCPNCHEKYLNCAFKLIGNGTLRPHDFRINACCDFCFATHRCWQFIGMGETIGYNATSNYRVGQQARSMGINPYNDHVVTPLSLMVMCTSYYCTNCIVWSGVICYDLQNKCISKVHTLMNGPGFRQDTRNPDTDRRDGVFNTYSTHCVGCYCLDANPCCNGSVMNCYGLKFIPYGNLNMETAGESGFVLLLHACDGIEGAPLCGSYNNCTQTCWCGYIHCCMQPACCTHQYNLRAHHIYHRVPWEKPMECLGYTNDVDMKCFMEIFMLGCYNLGCCLHCMSNKSETNNCWSNVLYNQPWVYVHPHNSYSHTCCGCHSWAGFKGCDYLAVPTSCKVLLCVAYNCCSCTNLCCLLKTNPHNGNTVYSRPCMWRNISSDTLGGLTVHSDAVQNYSTEARTSYNVTNPDEFWEGMYGQRSFVYMNNYTATRGDGVWGVIQGVLKDNACLKCWPCVCCYCSTT